MAENAPQEAPKADVKAEAKPVEGEAKAVVDEPKDEYIVNGKKILLTKAQAKAAVQKGLFADQTLKSVEVLKTKTAGLLEALKTPEGIISILKDPSLGASPKEVFRKIMQSDIVDDELKEDLAKYVYENVVKPSSLSPEQLEQQKKLNEYERLKKQEEMRIKQEEENKQRQIVDQVRNELLSEIAKQVKADKSFPQTEGTVRAVAEKLRVMHQKGAQITGETISKALGLVKKDLLMHQQAMFDTITDPEELVRLFGEDRALKISRALVARLQAKQKEQAKPETKEEVREKTTEKIDKKLNKNQYGYSILDI